MRRHTSLIPISRFHRSVLFLVLICKKGAPEVKGYPTTLEEKRAYALTFYKQKLKSHFELEEEKLLPFVTGRTPELDLLVTEIKEEYGHLSILFDDLESNSQIEHALHEMAIYLEKHVRKKERQFFQLIQESLSENEMKQLGFKIDM